VSVFGLGVRLVMQITLESNYLLQQAEHVFHGEDAPGVREYVASIGCRETNFRHLYADGKPRKRAYQEICDLIVGAAEAGERCAYLTPGNPAFLNTVVHKLRSATAARGIPFSVYPGVSSIDTLITDLLLPVSDTGLQCFEATHFVRERPAIDRRIPLLLFQPAVVEAFDVRHIQGAYLPGVKLLRDVLVGIYGPHQGWLLLQSAMSKEGEAVLAAGILSELVEKASYLELGTLFIPGDWQCAVPASRLTPSPASA
jgi:precorrin-6B methylase 1